MSGNNSAFLQQGPVPNMSQVASKVGGLMKPYNPSQNMSMAPQSYSAPTPNGKPIPGLLQSHVPTAPVKKMVDAQGNEVHFDTANTGKTKGVIPPKNPMTVNTPDTPAPLPTPTPQPNPIPPQLPTTPQVGSTTQNAQGVLNTGNLTSLEQQSRDALTQAGQMTPQEQAANANVARANQELKGYQNVQTLSPYAEAGMFSDRARTPAEVQDLERAPDLAGRASSTSGLLDSLGNIYGSADVAGANAALQGTQTAAGRGLSAASGNLGAAQTQASRAQSGAGTVFNSSLLSPTTQGQAAFSGLNGYQGGASSQFGDPNDPASAANVQAYKNYYDQYNAGLGGLNQAAALEPNILNTLAANPQLNNQPLSAITDLAQFLSGQTSQPGQQQLSTDVANYIKNLGIDQATIKSAISNQQSGTLVQLLNNLKDIATKNNNQLKATADSLKKKPTSSGGSAGGGLYDF